MPSLLLVNSLRIERSPSISAKHQFFTEKSMLRSSITGTGAKHQRTGNSKSCSLALLPVHVDLDLLVDLPVIKI